MGSTSKPNFFLLIVFTFTNLLISKKKTLYKIKCVYFYYLKILMFALNFLFFYCYPIYAPLILRSKIAIKMNFKEEKKKMPTCVAEEASLIFC